MTIKMFVQTNAGQASAPGLSVKVLRMLSVQRASDVAVGSGPNDALFAAGAGNAALDLSNVTGAIASQFPEGGSFDVTITPSTPPSS